MRPLFALLVAAIVVVGFAPIGAAAGATLDASPPSDVGVGPAPAQTTANETATNTTAGTETATATESNESTAATETATDTTESNESTATVEPGAQLAGVVAVQGVEIDSEVESRAFGQRVAAAATNDSKAKIVGSEVNESRERLEELRDRLAELEAARESGEISEGRYRAATAQTVAEINAVEGRLAQSNETASSLPENVREANGINTSNIERLRTEARNLTGPEVAEIARSVAGNNPGRGLSDAGPPGRSAATPGPGAPGGDAAGPNSGTETGERAGAVGSDRGGQGAGSQNATDRGTDGGTGGAASGSGTGGADPGDSGSGNGDSDVNPAGDGSPSQP